MAVVEAISEGQLQTQTGIYKAKEEDGPFVRGISLQEYFEDVY